MPDEDFFTLIAEGECSCVGWSVPQPLDRSKIKATTNSLLLFIVVQMIADEVSCHIVKALPIACTILCQGTVINAHAN
jgi:hypothetical protein